MPGAPAFTAQIEQRMSFKQVSSNYFIKIYPENVLQTVDHFEISCPEIALGKTWTVWWMF
jgi:hypothetical protein